MYKTCGFRLLSRSEGLHVERMWSSSEGIRPWSSMGTPKVGMPKGWAVSKAVAKENSSVRMESFLEESQSMRRVCSKAPVEPTVRQVFQSA